MASTFNVDIALFKGLHSYTHWHIEKAQAYDLSRTRWDKVEWNHL